VIGALRTAFVRLWLIVLGVLIGLSAEIVASEEVKVGLNQNACVAPNAAPAPCCRDEIKLTCGREKDIANGAPPLAIRSPKNEGKCRIILTYRDDVGRLVPGVQTLEPEERKTSFGCVPNGVLIRMRCDPGKNKDDLCILSYVP
jgi:hypothetical protein